VRAHAATFTGAFFIALLYSTKPDGSSPLPAAPTELPPPDTAAIIDSLIARPVSGTMDVSDSTGTDLEVLKRMALVIPVAGVKARDLVNSFQDARGDSRSHNALDIMAPRNTPVLSAAPGSVLKLHTSVAGGLTVYVVEPGSRYIFLYAHLDHYRQGLQEGMAVARGDTIAFVGTTGNANPAAPHLHFQVMRTEHASDWWRGTPINPFLIYRER
jgi:murein DD-endopeptidase MepM/ murein hydrolase activator NlpD